MAGRLQGISNSPLTEKGAADAERLGKRLAAVPIDKVFCSDLLRAQETAALIMQDRAPIVTDPRLRELHMGNWEAKLLQDLKEEEPEIYRQFETGSAGFHPAGGESMRTVWDRVKEALTEIEDDPADTALIVCHGKRRACFWTSCREKNSAVTPAFCRARHCRILCGKRASGGPYCSVIRAI